MDKKDLIHPSVVFSLKAAPLIGRIMESIGADRWRLVNHDAIDGNPLTLNTYFARGEGIGGITVSTVSFLSEDDRRRGRLGRVSVSCNFGRHEDIVSSVNFFFDSVTDENSGFKTAAIRRVDRERLFEGEQDPAENLVAGLGLIDGSRTYADLNEALAVLKQAADYAFEHCDG